MIAILDIDGTLVDSNYFHALAWFRAFRDHGVTVPVWRIHRAIGMGGDQLVAHVAGDETEERLGDAVRDTESGRYAELIGEVQPLPGARPLIVELVDRGHQVVLASSAKADEAEHYVDLLDARELAAGWTTSADVETTKPAPDLVEAALDKVGGKASGALMIGDSVYDVDAAKRAKVQTAAVLTGGFSEAELLDAGARVVVGSLLELSDELEQLVSGS